MEVSLPRASKTLLQPRVLGVIPARGGSKRVPRKNVRALRGKPCLVWTIEAARDCGLMITRLVVSTDDRETAEIAEKNYCGWIQRPTELSQGDLGSSWPACNHALEECERLGDRPYDIILLLHPTSPIRKAQHICDAINLLWQSSCECVASVNPDLDFNASIYAMKRNWFLHNRTQKAAVFVPLVMDWRHSVDINTEEDFILAEKALGDVNVHIRPERHGGA